MLRETCYVCENTRKFVEKTGNPGKLARKALMCSDGASF